MKTFRAFINRNRDDLPLAWKAFKGAVGFLAVLASAYAVAIFLMQLAEELP